MVGVAVGTSVAVDVGIGTGVLVGVGVGLAEGTGVLVGAGVGVAVGTGVFIGAGMGIAVGAGVASAVAATAGVAVSRTKTGVAVPTIGVGGGCWQPRARATMPSSKRENCETTPTELATADGGRIPLMYLPNSPTLNGRRILFTLLFFWTFGN